MKATLIYIDEESLIENYKSKWLIFKITQRKGKTVKIIVGNKENQYLGVIEWYAPFRKYSFEPAGGCIFEQTCMKDITTVLEELEKIRKNRNGK